MGVRENKVESYLDERFKRVGGLTRKWVSPGRDGVPDRICALFGKSYYVEVKTDDGYLSGSQIREIYRLRLAGLTVVTVYGEPGVDKFMNHVLADTGIKSILKPEFQHEYR